MSENIIPFTPKTVNERVVSLAQLINASMDAETLAKVLNAPATYQEPGLGPGYVRARLGLVYRVVDKALQDIVMSGQVDNASLNALAAYVNQQLQSILKKFSDTGISSQADLADKITREKYTFALSDDDGYSPIAVDVSGGVLMGGLRHRSVPYMQKYAVALLDIAGKAAFAVTADGAFESNGVAVKASGDATNKFSFWIADQEGYICFGVYKDGTVFIAGSEDDDKNLMVSLSNQRSGYMHIFSYGQSLSRGTGGLPPRSTTQPYNNKTFLSGVLKRGIDSDVNYTAFKPLVEEEYKAIDGESPTSATINTISSLIDADAPGDALNWRFVGTAPGIGSVNIEQLSKGTVYYNGMLDQIRAGVTLAAADNTTYSVWGLMWSQGERDWNRPSNDYIRKLITLKNDFAADCKSITGQNFTPPFIMYQTAGHRSMGSDNNYAAIAQWEATQKDVDLILACPMYQFEPSDVVHLTDDAYNQLGRYYGRAFYQTMYEGRRWVPLMPKSHIWQGRIIDIEFNVPTAPLVVDTTIVTETDFYGFGLWRENSYVSGVIGNVATAPGNRVIVQLNSDPLPGDLLTYGRGKPGDPNQTGPVDGPRGNIRDSAGDNDFYTDAANKVRYMHNWAVMFQLAYGQ